MFQKKSILILLYNFISVLAELLGSVVCQVDPKTVFGTLTKFELLSQVFTAFACACLGRIDVLAGPKDPQVTTAADDGGDVEGILGTQQDGDVLVG